MLDHVVQKGAKDCVIATAAWVANVDYDVAAARSPVPVGTRGLRYWETRRLLESLTGLRWRVSRKLFRSVSRLPFTDRPSVIIAGQPWHWRMHCLGLEGQRVYDSAFPHAFRRSEYPLKHWRVLFVFRPFIPEQLDEHRRINLWARFRAGLLSDLEHAYKRP